MTQKHHKELKDLRKKIALKQDDSISKVMINLLSGRKVLTNSSVPDFLGVMTVYYSVCSICQIFAITHCVLTKLKKLCNNS